MNFLARLTKELHLQIKVKAATQGKTMNDWINEAIKEKLEREGK